MFKSIRILIRSVVDAFKQGEAEGDELALKVLRRR